MNTKLQNLKSKFIPLLTFSTALLLLAATTWADVKGVGGDEPKPNDTTSSSPFYAWLFLVIFSMAILAISFKTSKRNSAQRSV